MAGPDAKAVLIRVDSSGALNEFALKDVAFAKADRSRFLQALDEALVRLAK